MKTTRRLPSAWLREQQAEMFLDTLQNVDDAATAMFYELPELPQALLDRLDSIEFEHLGPIATDIGEMTHDYDGNDEERLLAYDDAPHRLYVELRTHRFTCEARYGGGCGYLHLYSAATKPNVFYLLESDGEPGCWLGTRFGHFVN
jgi:hypothetical protein